MEDSHVVRFGKKIRRSGKAYSYTVWRTQIQDEIFWSLQGHNPETGSVWITTRYFGPPGDGKRFQQQIVLQHPTERRIKIGYWSDCAEGRNCVEVSREIVNCFRDKDNTFGFVFRIVRLKRRPYPQRMM